MASYDKLKSGWRFRIRQKNKAGEWTNYGESKFRTKKDAQIAAAKMQEKIDKGFSMVGSNVSITDYFNTWYRRYKVDKVAKPTEEWYYNTARWIEIYFGDTPLKSIRRSNYQDFITWLGTDQTHNEKPKKAMARSTVQKMNSFIRSMVKDAQEDGITDIDFTRKITLVGTAGKDASEKFLNLADFNKLIALAKSRANIKAITEYMIVTQAYTGMRFEEVLGLSWDRIDFDNLTIKIDRSWDYKTRPRRDHGAFAPLKNKPSYRTISIPHELAEILKKLHTEQAEAFMKSGYRDPDNLVFRNNIGDWASNHAINDVLKRLTEALGIPRITSHGLRHTHGSVLIYQGVSLLSVSHRLGHGNLQTTMTTYLHIIDEMQARDDTKISNILENLG